MYNILYPRLTKADPCLKSVNILCLVIKAEDLRHKPYLIHFLSKTTWIHPQNKALRHLHSMQGSSIFTKGREAGGARFIGVGGGGFLLQGYEFLRVHNNYQYILLACTYHVACGNILFHFEFKKFIKAKLKSQNNLKQNWFKLSWILLLS